MAALGGVKRTSGGKLRHVCYECNGVFKSHRSLQLHMRKHLGLGKTKEVLHKYLKQRYGVDDVVKLPT